MHQERCLKGPFAGGLSSEHAHLLLGWTKGQPYTIPKTQQPTCTSHASNWFSPIVPALHSCKPREHSHGCCQRGSSGASADSQQCTTGRPQTRSYRAERQAWSHAPWTAFTPSRLVGDWENSSNDLPAGMGAPQPRSRLLGDAPTAQRRSRQGWLLPPCCQQPGWHVGLISAGQMKGHCCSHVHKLSGCLRAVLLQRWLSDGRQ